MIIPLGFGDGIQNLNIEEENLLTIVEENSVRHEIVGEMAVREAVKNPIGTPRLSEIVSPGESISIVTSDITRPCPTGRILPVILEELFFAGVKAEDVTVTFALGSHREHTEEEKKKLMGPAWQVVRCRDSNPDKCINYGHTAHGTPIDIDEAVALADRRILIGNIEYHYFAGYSGGAKALMPGVSNRNAIQKNHSMMIKKEACAGNIEGNPIRDDLEEAALKCGGADFILNVVLDSHKEVVGAFAGDMILAHREGCRFLDTLYGVGIPSKADIVIVSQGGSPKDLNLYQTQKALDNAKHAVRKGGIIILVGSCKEGLGEKTFEEWITAADKPEELIERVKNDFKLGGHKAAAIAMVLQDADIYLVSEMNKDLVESIFMKPYTDVQDAYDDAIKILGPDSKVIVMPWGGSTLPSIEAKRTLNI